jgi:uncharacterized protein (TIGR00645 family)
MSTPAPYKMSPLSAVIFSSRWLQLPLYLGLIVAQAVYVVKFLRELWELLGTTFGFISHPAAAAAAHAHDSETVIMLAVLGLIDVVMISNLLVMVIVGGFETFVSRLRLEGHPDQPEWLSHVNAAVLKVKLATAIIGISSIHLLKTFIEAGSPESKLTNDQMFWQTMIHLAFVGSAVAIAWIDRIMSSQLPRARNAEL